MALPKNEREALEQAGVRRGGSLTVPSSQAIEAEVDVIEMAIDHPPRKADHFGTAVSVAGAVALILKTIAAPVDHYGPKDLGVIIASAVLGIALATRYVTALFAKTPIKDKAKEHIRKYRVAQGWKPEVAQVSNWRRLSNALWAHVFRRVELPAPAAGASAPVLPAGQTSSSNQPSRPPS